MKNPKEDKNIKFGVVLSYVAMAVSMIGNLFISNRVLNLIGDYNYGLYAFVNSITSWLTVISTALTSSFLRFTTLEAHNKNGDTSRTNSIYFQLLFSLSSIVVSIGLLFVVTLFFNRVCFTKYNWEESKLIYILFVL